MTRAQRCKPTGRPRVKPMKVEPGTPSLAPLSFDPPKVCGLVFAEMDLPERRMLIQACARSMMLGKGPAARKVVAMQIAAGLAALVNEARM